MKQQMHQLRICLQASLGLPSECKLHMREELGLSKVVRKQAASKDWPTRPITHMLVLYA